MRSHLRARQADDLLRDLARRVQPSPGPFATGEGVFFWFKDASKVKDQGKWVRGKVLPRQGPMVTIEAQKAVVRVSQSKVRRDHDEWHDAPLPKQLKTEAELQTKEGKVTFQPDETKRETVEAASVAQVDLAQHAVAHAAQQHECVWTIQSKGKIDVLEIFSGCARASMTCADVGLRVRQPIDLLTGLDLMTPEGRTKAWRIIEDQAPTHVFLAPVCTPWSVLQSLNAAPVPAAQLGRSLSCHFLGCKSCGKRLLWVTI